MRGTVRQVLAQNAIGSVADQIVRYLAASVAELADMPSHQRGASHAAPVKALHDRARRLRQ